MGPGIATILSVVGVSLLSLMGVVTLWVGMDRLKRWLMILVALAAGAMLADAFLHLLPHAVEHAMEGGAGHEELKPVFLTVLGGMFTFFFLEKVIQWQHSHEPCEEDHVHPIGKMNLVGDALHNFIDGILIAGAYMGGGLGTGLAVTLAVALHEIPQEIGDLAILLHAGYTRRKALAFNLISALAAVLGAVLVLLIGAGSEKLIAALIPFTAGAFIYIAAADLIPEIRKEGEAGRAWGLMLAFTAGIGLMLLI